MDHEWDGPTWKGNGERCRQTCRRCGLERLTTRLGVTYSLFDLPARAMSCDQVCASTDRLLVAIQGADRLEGGEA